MRIIAFLLFLLPFAALAQQPTSLYTKQQLEEKRTEILNSIKETENELAAVNKDKNATMGQLRILQNKLAQRQSLIENTNEELNDIDNGIKSSAKEVGSLRLQLEQLKIRYAQSLRYSYETRSSYGMLAFLFSSADFNDAMRRMKYLKTFREYRKQQVVQIRTTQNQLQHKIGVLNTQKAQQDELLNTQKAQREELAHEKDQTNEVIESLKGKEGELMKEIQKNKQTTARINKAIQAFIEAEIAKAQEEARKKAAALAKANPAPAPVPTAAKPGKPAETATNNVKYTPKAKPTRPEDEAPLLLTPSDQALASNFEENRGKLYWPVEKGYITGHFGEHPHPLEPKVMINNFGVLIKTEENAPIRAVFDGDVDKVFSLVGSQQVVLIRHGNYFTVYNNLGSVQVKEGQHVTAKQVIGHVALDDEHIPTVDFEIWKSSGKKGTIKLDPEQWIGKAH